MNTPGLVLELIRDAGSLPFTRNFDPCYLELTGHPLDRATPLLGPHVVQAPFDRACAVGDGAPSSAMAARGARADRHGPAPHERGRPIRPPSGLAPEEERP